MSKLITPITLTVAAAIALYVSPSFSANARHPYQNVNHANDRSNNTGNAGTARLNDEQLAGIRNGAAMGAGTYSSGTDQKALGGQR